MMLAIGDTIGECHLKLKDMMERPGGGFKWSYTHNSPFKLSKTVLINFRDPLGTTFPYSTNQMLMDQRC